MGSTSFSGFSCPNLFFVFLTLSFFRNLLHIFYVPILDKLVTTEFRFFALKSKKEKVLD